MKRAFQLFDVDAFFRATGAQRVAESASEKLADVLEESAEDLIFRAKIYSRHAGRREVTRDDVLLAASDLS